MDNSKINEIVTRDLRGRLSKVHQVFMPDESYKVISRKKVGEILGDTSVERFNYQKHRFDCDDYAHLLKGEFIKAAYNSGQRYPYAFGILWGNVKVQGSWTGHAINWFIDEKDQLWLVEPQNDEIFEPDKDVLKEVYFLLM